MVSRAATARHAVPAGKDAYGQEIWSCYQGRTTYEVVEREDGLIDIGSALPYFQEYDRWPDHEREAIAEARGPVLDIGCGAGRVALYLQQQGREVMGIDNSPLAVRVTRLRGVKRARILAIEDIHTLRRKFDTIVLFGNNFGLLGGVKKARRLLSTMHRITGPEAAIIAAAADPYATRDPLHLAYQEQNRRRGRLPGQLRLRIRYRQLCGPWFDYLFVAPDEMCSLVENTGWTIGRIIRTGGPSYAAILTKCRIGC